MVIGAEDLAVIRGAGGDSPFSRIIGAVMPLPPGRAVDAVRGGEQLRFDDAVFTVIATPGHSPGSVMYLYREVLFTGDSLMRKKDGVAIVPALFSQDRNRNRAFCRA